jgi:hypothetical protein
MTNNTLRISGWNRMMNAMSQISAIARSIQFSALRLSDCVMNDTINMSMKPSKIRTAIVSRKTEYKAKNSIVTIPMSSTSINVIWRKPMRNNSIMTYLLSE